jgi:hypothetical protein
MKRHKNYVFARVGAVILLVSFVFSASGAVLGHDGKKIEPNEPVAVVQTSTVRGMVLGNLLERKKPRPSSASYAESADGSDDLSIDTTVGDEQVVFKRRHRRSGGGTLIVIQIIAVLIAKPSGNEGRDIIDLNVTITGDDAVRGSLLYSLAWLAGYADPLGTVLALGYDISVNNEHVHSCSGQQRSHTCEEQAHRLATLIDATLGLASSEERIAFRRDASAIGVAPDCSLRVP